MSSRSHQVLLKRKEKKKKIEKNRRPIRCRKLGEPQWQSRDSSRQKIDTKIAKQRTHVFPAADRQK